MADSDKDEKAKAAEGDDESSGKFSREELIADASSLLGVPSFVVAGALTDVKGEGDLTVDQAHKAVEKYHEKEA